MHTAQHLVSECLASDLVHGRTVILVTHHISLCLPKVSYLVELVQGKVVRQGSIQELQKLDLLRTVVEQENDPITHEDFPRTQGNGNGLNKSTSQSLGNQANGRLIEAESRAEGRVSLRTYITYIRAAGLFSWVLTVTLMLLIRFINIGNQVFLARWGEAYEEGCSPAFFDYAFRYPWTGLPAPDIDVKPWLMIYLYISLAGAFSVLFYLGLGYYASLKASRSLFRTLLQRLTRAPARFFDVTPIGRILNRFTTDMGTIDGALQNSARNCLSGMLNFVASFTVILVVVPGFAPFACSLLGCTSGWRRRTFVLPGTFDDSSLSRYPQLLLAMMSCYEAFSHIRAFGMEDRYQNSFYAQGPSRMVLRISSYITCIPGR
jgi:ABC-type multidrug transport system fused ATPase/permease subunit